MDGEASYKKLNDGSWGIRTTGYVPDEGDTVDVTTKSGEVKQEEVSKLIWSGTNDNGDPTAICEIVKTDKDGNKIEKPKQPAKGTGPQKAGSKPPQRCKCAGCGTTDPAKEYYCGDCVISGSAVPGSAKPPEENETDEIPF